MSSKQGMMAEALEEQIIRLERELVENQEQLREALQRGDSIERAKDFLQCEAHDIVHQWSRKTSELQERLNNCAAELGVTRQSFSVLEERNMELQSYLRDSEAQRLSCAKELEKATKTNQELTEKLTAMERGLCFASQKMGALEQSVDEMNSEMVLKKEQIESFAQKECELRETLSVVRIGKQRAEDECSEVRDRLQYFQGKVSEANQSLGRMNSLLVLTEEEALHRGELFSSHANSIICVLHSMLLCQMDKNMTLERLLKKAEVRNEALVKEGEKLQWKLDEAGQNTSKICATHAAETETHRERIRTLELEVSKFHNAHKMWLRKVEALQEEVDRTKVQLDLLKESNDSVKAELRATKDCYTVLLVEHDELKVSTRRRLHESEAEISRLSTEKAAAISRYETELQENRSKCGALIATIQSMEREAFSYKEIEARQYVLAEFTGDLTRSTQVYIHRILSLSGQAYIDAMNNERKVTAFEQLINKKQLECNTHISQAKVLEERLFSLQQVSQDSQLKIGELSGALLSARENAEGVMHENKWLNEQVYGMREELRDIDVLFNRTLNEMRDQNEKHQKECAMLADDLSSRESLLNQVQEKLVISEERCAALTSERVALSKSLFLAEEELSKLKLECSSALERERLVLKEKGILEKKLSRTQKDYANTENQIKTLIEELRTHNVKQQLMSSSSRTEVETAKAKLNTYIEMYEDAKARVMKLTKLLQESKGAYDNLHESHQKAKAALEEAKQRCSRDTLAIQELVEERQRIAREREALVEKYNQVYDMLKAVKEEKSGAVIEDVQRLTDLCLQQEIELQQLRHQNVVLKRGIVRIADSARNQPEGERFVERLNLAEGPLRRPKKRPASDL